MTFTDGIRVANITLEVEGYDYTADFFCVGNLTVNQNGEHEVNDIDYLIEQANDYIAGVGDFDGCSQNDADLTVEWITE